jgi:hypothetical protein
MSQVDLRHFYQVHTSLLNIHPKEDYKQLIHNDIFLKGICINIRFISCLSYYIGFMQLQACGGYIFSRFEMLKKFYQHPSYLFPSKMQDLPQ